MQKTGKLELTWVGKYDDKVVEPRILMEDVEKSYGDPTSDNMLIHGDNLILYRLCNRILQDASNVSTSIRLITLVVRLSIMMTIWSIAFGCRL